MSKANVDANGYFNFNSRNPINLYGVRKTSDLNS